MDLRECLPVKRMWFLWHQAPSVTVYFYSLNPSPWYPIWHSANLNKMIITHHSDLPLCHEIPHISSALLTSDTFFCSSDSWLCKDFLLSSNSFTLALFKKINMSLVKQVMEYLSKFQGITGTLNLKFRYKEVSLHRLFSPMLLLSLM